MGGHLTFSEERTGVDGKGKEGKREETGGRREGKPRFRCKRKTNKQINDGKKNKDSTGHSDEVLEMRTIFLGTGGKPILS